ncbi:10186_t:CDS:2, partial [Gigaspora rosea]
CNNFEEALDYLNKQLKSKIKEPMTNFSDTIPEGRRDFHVNLMSSFLAQGCPPSGYGVNDFSSTLKVKHAIMSVEWQEITFKNNPIVMGFIVEKACIANIWKNGLTVN